MLFLTPTVFKLAILLVTTGLSVGSWAAAADTVLLRVNGQRDPVEFNCPVNRGQALAATPRAAAPVEENAQLPQTPTTQMQTQTPAQPTQAMAPRPKVGLKIGLWGDSHTASGTFTDSLLEALRRPSAQAHPGFITPTFGLKGVRHPLRRACLSDDWQLALAYRSPTENPQAYAKSLAYVRTETAGAFMWLDFRYPHAQTRVQWADIHVAQDPADRPPVLGISVDDGAEAIVHLGPNHSQRLRVQPEQAFATLRLRVIAGSIRIDGLAPVYAGPTQTLLDVFSIPGATAKGWRVADTAHLRREDPLDTGYDVVILQSGTNESLDPDFKVGLYEAQLNTSITRLKAAYPRARCILIGPPDAQRSANTLRLINDSQQRLATAKGCTHWNWQKAMGGPGASVRWLAKGLMQADLLHLTPAGYAQSARSLARMVAIKGR
jgi:lysophospholipase L1-like esterase